MPKEYLWKALEATVTCRFSVLFFVCLFCYCCLFVFVCGWFCFVLFFTILKTCPFDVFGRYCLAKLFHKVLCISV